MNTRKIGKKLESYIVGSIPNSKATKNSGAGMIKGDIISSQWVVECKKRNTESVSIDLKVWKKLNNSIPIHSLKTPVLILENVTGQKWAVMDLTDWLRVTGDKYNAQN